MAITSPIFLFSTLQLRPILATDTRRQYAFGEYLALRLYATAAACLAVALICVVWNDSSSTKWAVALVAVSKAFDSISDIFHARLQQDERMDRIAIGLIARGVISLVVLAAILFATRNAAFAVGGLAFGSAVVALGFDANNGEPGIAALRRSRWFRRPSLLPESGTARRLLSLTRTALPLGLVLLLSTLIGNAPRLFVKRDLGDAALGHFGALAYVMAAANVLIASVGQSAMPRLARLYSAGQIRTLIGVLARFVAIAAAAGALGIAAAVFGGKQILTILYRAEYAAHTDAFVLLMCVAAIMSVATILSYAVMAVRSFNSQLPLYTAMLASTCVLCQLLVPRYGLSGAALGLLGGVAVQIVGSVAVLVVAIRRRLSRGAESPVSAFA
jgi:O-antigen/teichoic acid export membrane protein